MTLVIKVFHHDDLWCMGEYEDGVLYENGVCDFLNKAEAVEYAKECASLNDLLFVVENGAGEVDYGIDFTNRVLNKSQLEILTQ